MLNFKKSSLLILIALFILFIIPMSFAADADNNLTADTVSIDETSSDVIQASDDSESLSVEETSDVLTSDYKYVSTPSPSSVDYTKGESCVVDVVADYESEDYWSSLDLSGSSIFVYIDGASSGIELDGIASESKSFSVDLKDLDSHLEAGNSYNLVFRPPNGIFTYASVELSDCQFNPLTVNVKEAASTSDYLYVSTPSQSNVDYTKGESSLVTFTIEYNGLNFDYVNFAVFVDGSNWAALTLWDVDSYDTTVTIDLKDIEDSLDVGTHTVVVRHTNDMYDTNWDDLGPSDCQFNPLTVNVLREYDYETSVEPSTITYLENNSHQTVTVKADTESFGQLEKGDATWKVYINGADKGIDTGVDVMETEFDYDLSNIIDYLVEGENTLLFYPDKDTISRWGGYSKMNFIPLALTFVPTPVSNTGIVYVDASNGNDDNDGSEKTPVLTLSKAVKIASNSKNTEHKIIVREGTYNVFDLNINSPLDISADGEVIFDAQQLGRILNVQADTNISGITFANGKADNGGAIEISDAKVTIDNCMFKDNVASGWGAAIYWNADNGALTNSKFTNNTCRNAVVVLGDYDWNTGKFSGNNALVENCVFDDNHNVAYGNCMGLDVQGSDVTIKNTNFTNNKGEVYSEHGALYIKGDNAVVDNCLFENNSMGMAAAMQLDGDDTKITNSKFINNTVSTGISTRSGAIEIQSSAEITGCTFINNGGADCKEGGAINIVYNNYGGEIKLADNEFINNTAAKGAAIYVDGGSEDGCKFESLDISGNKFENNTAEEGSAVYVDNSDGTVAISNNEFKSDSDDEPIFVDEDKVSGNVEKSDNKIINSSAVNDTSSDNVTANGTSSNASSNVNNATTSTNPVATKKVTKQATKIVAKKKTFKAKKKVKKYTITLKTKKGKVIKKAKVTLKIKGKTYKAKTNKKGKATFKIKKLTKKGKYTAKIKFAGNKNFKASSKKVKITVKK